MKKSIFTQEAEAKIKANKPAGTPWYINLFVFLLDSVATVVILALAVLGARSLIEANMGKEIKLGIAVLVVGLLASRLLERVFARR